MRVPARSDLLRTLPGIIALLLAAGGLPGQGEPVLARWANYGGDARHTALSPVAAQGAQRILWSAPVDLQPQYSGGDLFIHYGTPLVTAGNTVLFPVKTGAAGGFRVEARRGDTGALLWTLDTDYDLPDHDWVPSLGCCLLPDDRVAIPAAGGTVLLRTNADVAEGSVERVAFYGTGDYEDDPASFDATVRIDTPLTADDRGNLYFGFVADPAAPLHLRSGFARISSTGRGRWISADHAAGDPGMTKVANNCAPALDRRGRLLYGAVTDADGTGFGAGTLVALDAKRLARRHAAPLDEGLIAEDGTASPMVGPDGHVFFGVLTFGNHFRGRMLQFSRSLSSRGIAGGFGWDDTASVVPAEAVPSYAGGARYLILTKYNDYVEAGGSGVNRLAVLDPRASMTDPIDDSKVMAEVLIVAGPTPDVDLIDLQHPDAVREWCINTAAVDPVTGCALVNNEDGVLYRWDFATNALSESVVLTPGIGEAYTPTVVGPGGIVYAINNATLFAVGE